MIIFILSIDFGARVSQIDLFTRSEYVLHFEVAIYYVLQAIDFAINEVSLQFVSFAEVLEDLINLGCVLG